jgi:F0F1-type ATP synthase alpha subunit
VVSDVHGYLTKLRVDQIPEFERRLAEHLELKYPDFAEKIHNTGKMDEAMEVQLKSALQALLADYEIAV